VRVAYAVGTDGYTEELCVPPTYIDGVAHVDWLRATRDKRFVELKKELGEWIARRDVPQWLVDETRYIDQWKSQKHAMFLLREWRAHRFAGDEDVFAALEAWVKQDRHLRFWECDEREKLLRMRKDFYRCTAKKWAANYARIIVGDMDLRDFAEEPDPEEGPRSEGNVQRRLRFLAAPSELCGGAIGKETGALVQAARNAGGECVKVDSAWKTQICNACGIVLAFAARKNIEHTCECGARWDQDANHARNLLASDKVAREKARALAPSVTADVAPKKETGGRWKKRRSQKAAKAPEITP
jgi:hypothetical protein